MGPKNRFWGSQSRGGHPHGAAVVCGLALERHRGDGEELPVDAVAEAAWVAKYQEEGRFGLPLDSDDPLVAMQRCECLLALYLLEHHPDGLAADDGAPPLRADDFIDEERLGVLRGR